jgi:hypothetical protein
MKDLEFVRRVLAVFDGFGGSPEGDELWWRVDEGYAPVTFFAKCSDFFYWGTADLEEITPNNVGELEKAVEDCRAVEKICATLHAVSLFCARVRKTRPQGACYPSIDKRLWPLFDACGPERPVNLTNPKERPKE